jgi:hypothetical protein
MTSKITVPPNIVGGFVVFFFLVFGGICGFICSNKDDLMDGCFFIVTIVYSMINLLWMFVA